VHLTCSQSQLSKSLGIVGRAVAPRSSLPVTGHVLLATDNGRLKLAATNMDIAIVSWIDAEIDDEGSVSVPARLFTDLVSSLPNDKVELDLSRRTQTLLVKGVRFSANVKGLDASEFPRIDVVAEKALLELAAADLRQAIEDVQFAAAKDETRPQLAGLLFRARESALTLVGCDGFRLSICRLPLDTPVSEDVDLIVPARTMAEVARIHGALDENVTVSIKPNHSQILFHTSSVEIVSRLIDGSYVEFQRLLDQVARHNVRATVTTADLQRAARFTSFVSRDANNGLRIEIKPSDGVVGPGVVTLQATAAQVGDNTTDIDAVVDGVEARIALDNTYLTDAADAIHTQQVTISATAGQTLPVLLKPVGTEDVLHLIMPMHLQ
jgi:DNA polymerase-3 subunit beta